MSPLVVFLGAILANMFTYVNHQAMGDLFRPLEHDNNPTQRAKSLQALMSEISDHVYRITKKTCFDLKKQGWVTGQIADELGLSERMVKALIKTHAEDTGVRNPLVKHQIQLPTTDISHLVSRVAADRRRSTQTTHPTDKQQSTQADSHS